MSPSITPVTPHARTNTPPTQQAPRTADAGSFTRSPSVDSMLAHPPSAGHRAASVEKLHKVPRLTPAELKATGAEILDLYQKKFINRNERYLSFNSEGKIYKISGFDMRHVLIQSDDGIVQLGADGTPRSHPILKIGRDDMTLALMRTLATLRHHTPAAKQHA